MLGLSITLMATAAVLSGQPPRGPLQTQIEHVTADRNALRAAGGWMRVGHLNGSGEFVPAVTQQFVDAPVLSAFGTAWVYNLLRDDEWEASELRSGALVRGVLIGDRFVPQLGGTVAAGGADRPADQWVYNHPEWGKGFWTPVRTTALAARRKGKPPPGLAEPGWDPNPGRYGPARSDPPLPPPSGWRLVGFREAYMAHLPAGTLGVVRVVGESAEYGHLDNWGEFIPNYFLPVTARTSAPEPAVLPAAPGGEWRFIYNIPLGDKPEPVYEFRSGRLIKGVLQRNGFFVPMVGSTVIAFKDYQPNADLRIYNLPGVLKQQP